MESLDPLHKGIANVLGFYIRQVINAAETASKLISDVEYHIEQNGHIGQIECFVDRISGLPNPIQTEIEKFSLTDDEKIFVRVRHCNTAFPPPDDWKPAPAPVRADVDYNVKPPKITIYLNDRSHYELPAEDSRATLVFALREHFTKTQENAE